MIKEETNYNTYNKMFDLNQYKSIILKNIYKWIRQI